MVAVSSNLVAALPMLYKHFPNNLLWTDNLSINQEDEEEKSHQVALMGRIFASAETVVVWLGGSDVDGDSIFRDLEELSAIADLELKDEDEDESKREAQSKRRLDLLYRLSQVPWFHRVWTFQEIRLAQNAVVLLDTHILPWTTFIQRIQKLRTFEPHHSTVPIHSESQGYYRFGYPAQDRFFAILDELNATAGTLRHSLSGATVLKTEVSTVGANDLAGLLFLTWYRDATEQRDKVYSLLSDELIETANHGIKIDYKIPWNQLCIQAARASINTAKNLKILKIAGMSRRWKSPVTNRWQPDELSHLLGHPSWAPDWWRPPQQTRRHSSLVHDERGCFAKLDFCCPADPTVQDVSDTSPFLVLDGVLLGIVNVDDDSGPLRIHEPPSCGGFRYPYLQSPTDESISVAKVTMSHFVADVERHLNGQCYCTRDFDNYGGHHHHHHHYHGLSRYGFDNSIAASYNGGGGFNQPQQRLNFSSFSFPVFRRQKPDETPETQFPAQVLSYSVESGDWLVLLEGGGHPFVLRPARDGWNGVCGVRGFTGYSTKSELPADAGMFVLVGEASLCWDHVWPGQWSSYCRAGKFVIV